MWESGSSGYITVTGIAKNIRTIKCGREKESSTNLLEHFLGGCCTRLYEVGVVMSS